MADEGMTPLAVLSAFLDTHEFVGDTDIDAAREALATVEEDTKRLLYISKHLFQMIPQNVWRENGAEWQGHYEGDYWAEQVHTELVALEEKWKGG